MRWLQLSLSERLCDCSSWANTNPTATVNPLCCAHKKNKQTCKRSKTEGSLYKMFVGLKFLQFCGPPGYIMIQQRGQEMFVCVSGCTRRHTPFLSHPLFSWLVLPVLLYLSMERWCITFKGKKKDNKFDHNLHEGSLKASHANSAQVDTKRRSWIMETREVQSPQCF